jgi:hypothetical protein
MKKSMKQFLAFLIGLVMMENGIEKSVSYALNPGDNSTVAFYLWVSTPSSVYPQSYIATTPWSLVLE